MGHQVMNDENRPKQHSNVTFSLPFSVDLDRIARVFAYIGVICYVLGLFVVNLYLIDLGTADFSLLRPRFVLAGALALVPLAMTLPPYLSWYWLTFNQSEPDPSSAANRWRKRIAHFFSFLSVALLAVGGMMIAVQYLTGLDSLFRIFRTALWVQFPIMSLLTYLQLAHSEWRRSKNHDILEILAGYYFQVFLIGTSVFLYIYGFSHSLYPLIAQQAGGGRPITARLVVDSDSLDEARQSGIEVTETDFVSPPLGIMWEGEDFYVVRLPPQPKGIVVRIGKNMISSVIVNPPAVTPTDGTPVSPQDPTRPAATPKATPRVAPIATPTRGTPPSSQILLRSTSGSDGY